MMKFSIRTLLAVIAVAALAMVAFQSHRRAITERNRGLQIAIAIETLEQQQTVQVDYRETKLAQDDLRASLRDNRDRCEQAIQTLVQRYASIEPGDAETLSIRRYPTIRTETTQAPVSFKLLVPEDRPIWLKFGLHPQDTNAPSDGVEGSEDVLLAESIFDQAGPFELRLPPGEHLVAFAMEDQVNRFRQLQVLFNDQLLAQLAVMVGNNVRRSGYQTTGADQQADFDGNRTLPRLVTIDLSLRDESNSESIKRFKVSAWLSNHSSSFRSFPARH